MVRGNPHYEEAYDGMAFLGPEYGERALWQMVHGVFSMQVAASLQGILGPIEMLS